MSERPPELADLPELLTVEEVRRFLRVGRSTAYALVRSGELRSVRVGGQLRVPRAALEEIAEVEP